MIKYVKDNCFKARDFKDADEARAFLKQWLDNIANKRVHGTTKKVPAEVFESIEKEKLLLLPPQEYIICDIKICTVMHNCHISYKGNYYSVPYEHIGEKVDVIATDNLLRIFYQGKEIALHPLVKDSKGQHITNKEHYPRHKTITPEEIKSRYREQMAEIGPHALEFFEKFLANSGNKYSYRSIAGILSLRKKYDDKIC